MKRDLIFLFDEKNKIKVLTDSYYTHYITPRPNTEHRQDKNLKSFGKYKQWAAYKDNGKFRKE
jgi:hypothetical protein